MDTSESDHSGTDTDWVESGKRPRKKRNSKAGGQSRAGSDVCSSDNSRTENSGICCSCSKSSFCKLKKCECRAAGGTCGDSCSCAPSKCTNRETIKVKELDNFPELAVEGTDDDKQKYHELASHGAMLLQNALVDEPAETNDDAESKRKPLSEIGNKMVCFSPTLWYKDYSCLLLKIILSFLKKT